MIELIAIFLEILLLIMLLDTWSKVNQNSKHLRWLKDKVGTLSTQVGSLSSKAAKARAEPMAQIETEQPESMAQITIEK